MRDEHASGGEQSPGAKQSPGGEQSPDGKQSPRGEQSRGGEQSPGGERSSRTAVGPYRVVWPRSRRAIDPQALAGRPATLDGAMVAFLWDYLFRGDEIFPVIAEELRARYDGITIIDYPEFGSTHGPREGEIVAGLGERLRALGVDAVVSGMAC